MNRRLYRRVVHWFRRDLRITDNTALNAALSRSEEIIPVYIKSHWRRHHGWTGPGRQRFLCGSLAALEGNLKALGADKVDHLIPGKVSHPIFHIV